MQCTDHFSFYDDLWLLYTAFCGLKEGVRLHYTDYIDLADGLCLLRLDFQRLGGRFRQSHSDSLYLDNGW